MKRTFHLFSFAMVLTLIVSVVQATSVPAQVAWTLTPTAEMPPTLTPEAPPTLTPETPPP